MPHPSSHPRGYRTILLSASPKIKHIKGSNGCSSSPTSPHSVRVWHFSHFTHHYIQPVSITVHQRRRKNKERAPFSPLTCFYSSSPSVYLSLPSLFTPSPLYLHAVCACMCVTLCSAPSAKSSAFIFAFDSVFFMCFHTARFSLPVKVTWKAKETIIS